MAEFGAIALPIILAVLGVVVSFEAVPKGGRLQWVWVGSFAVLGILAVISQISDRHATDKDQRELKESVKGLKDSIEKMTKEPAQPLKQTQRDPDGIYQNGNSIGKIIGARITLNESKVYFREIQNAAGFDTSKPFEYRDYILRFIRADSYTGMRISTDGVAMNVYGNVVSEIIGRSQN
jgi:hypothetical protein